MTNEKLFTAEYTDEAKIQLKELSSEYREKIIEAIGLFEKVGKLYKNINDLGDGLFEIKPKGVRAYFMYDNNRRRIIIIGFVCLKKSQKAPKNYIKQARSNIKKYIQEMEANHEKNNNN
ncbi:MAG: type II toxin-antitoxin system RelE/ParE family toxin [Candidatus Gastranaerophilales bacterium]|nr:type II toxin-antitoxin system RelE/ParE family toxin [Candidatus Gastranaerophilales bacterium]